MSMAPSRKLQFVSMKKPPPKFHASRHPRLAGTVWRAGPALARRHPRSPRSPGLTPRINSRWRPTRLARWISPPMAGSRNCDGRGSLASEPNYSSGTARSTFSSAMLATVARLFPADAPASRTNALSKSRLIDNLFVSVGYHRDFQPASVAEQTRAETGLFHLSRRQYTEALNALLHSTPDYWMDAAYVAERVLKLEELRGICRSSLAGWPAIWQRGDAGPTQAP